LETIAAAAVCRATVTSGGTPAATPLAAPEKRARLEPSGSAWKIKCTSLWHGGPPPAGGEHRSTAKARAIDVLRGTMNSS
jgi:hypothetical protein